MDVETLDKDNLLRAANIALRKMKRDNYKDDVVTDVAGVHVLPDGHRTQIAVQVTHLKGGPRDGERNKKGR